ncbi:MAG: hypothetical protein WCO66_03195 [Candidatus Absconditabacteria bacterium]
MFKQIVVGLITAGIGGAISYFSQSIAEAFGRVDRFERTFSSTRSGYAIVGFVAIIIGFLILFGVFPLGTPVSP